MCEELQVKQPNFYKQALFSMKNGKFFHAYLIEKNDNIESIVENYLNIFIEQLLISTNNDLSIDKIHHLLEQNNYPDLLKINPINNVIKKEQIIQVMDAFKNKSQYNGYQIYVIYDAEKLNLVAANTLLKFLEEPEENIIAILVTNNRYQLINTILSRCQVLSLRHESVTFDLSNYNEFEVSFFNQILNAPELLMLSFDTYYENLFKTRELSLETLNHAKQFFKVKFENNYSISTLEIVEKIETFIVKLKYNVNLKLWLDGLLLSFLEEENENS